MVAAAAAMLRRSGDSAVDPELEEAARWKAFGVVSFVSREGDGVFKLKINWGGRAKGQSW